MVKQHSADISHIRECCNHVEGLVSEELEEKVEAKTGHTHQPHQQEDDHPRYMGTLYAVPHMSTGHPGNEASEQPTPYKVSNLVTRITHRSHLETHNIIIATFVALCYNSLTIITIRYEGEGSLVGRKEKSPRPNNLRCVLQLK